MGKAQEEVNQMLEMKMKKDAEKYYEAYRPQMEALEQSLLAKVRGGKLHIGDYYALGKQLEQFDSYKAIVEEEGNVNLLGKIPQIAYDVITAVQGVSVIPILAAVQPVDEERGTVYFKTIRSGTTKGSQTAGATVVDPRTSVITPSGYASNFVTGEVLGTTVATQLAYTGIAADVPPIRSQTVKITVQTLPNVYAEDDGKGNLLGKGLSGTINYDTGAATLDFAADPGAGKQIYVEYQLNYEKASDIPKMDTYFDSKGIMARVYTLKGTIGLLQAYGMRRRFGMVADDELSKDLVVEINREIGGDMVRLLVASAVGNTNFNKTPDAGVSYFEHKQTFKDKLADAEAVLVGNAGRGTISMIVAGRKVASIIQTLPGFTKLTDGTTLGMHVFGTLDGITVVRVPEDSLMANDDAYVCWKGMSPFEAPLVYSPYMPLVVTGTLPMANPLMQQKAAAVWAGVDTLVPNFVTKLHVQNA